jgi:transposase InsO family protein
MAWKECDCVSLRREFVSLGAVEGANLALLCRRFGISRRTGHKWLARFREEGEAGLADRSRRPHRFRSPTPAAMEQQVLAVRQEHPQWGGRKIAARLEHLAVEAIPAASTITAILRRHGEIAAEESAKRKALIRFERPEPNDLWQMDFKGEFRLSNGQWCHPLTVLDDHSRYSLVLEACGNQRRGTVQQHLVGVFRRYGLPRNMLMDNGPPWGTPCRLGGPSILTVWLMDLDVAVLHGRPYHPQTQGKEERFHRTLKLEVLQGRTFDNHFHMQQRFAQWRESYNHERPHEALALQVPASCYRASPREYREQVQPFEYDPTFLLRQVTAEGRLVFRGREHRVGKAFARRAVGLRNTGQDGQWAVYYRTFRIGAIEERGGKARR